MKKSQKSTGIITVSTPIDDEVIHTLKIGDQIELQGKVYCGRDAVLPRLADFFLENRLDEINVNLKGSVIFHSAVSPAGIGPTTSSKVEIEGSIPTLSRAGVKIHLGKGALSMDTAKALAENNALFAITPPVSALFTDKIEEQRVAAFKEEGMEALYELKVKGLPAIIAIAHGKSIFTEQA